MVEAAGPSGLPDLPPGQAWYTEPVRATLHHSLVLKRVIFSGATALQRVDILDTDPFGKTLVLDGKTQSAATDEFIYHEALVHPALVAHDAPADVFIAGGGEGATLREVLAHRTVRRAVMADLDGELVGLCREHLPEWHAGAFDDPRAELEIGDARAALERRGAEFDVIVIDVTDPTEAGPSLPLFTAEFYAMAARRLKPGGVLVTQAGPATLGMTKALTAIRHTVAQAFGRAAAYAAEVPSFGGAWGFVIAGGPDAAALDAAEADRRVAERVERSLRFYDGKTNQGVFALPKWLRERLAAERHVIRPDAPVYID